MNRASRGIRRLALVAAVLLLWCHGLDATFQIHTASTVAHAAVAGDTALALPAQHHPELPQVSCCFGGAGSNLLSASLARTPSLPAPLLAALLSLLLLPVALRSPRPATRRYAPHRTGLVQQAVLIRI